MCKLFVILALIGCHPAFAATNLIVNGGFENTTAWQVGGTAAGIRSNPGLANTGSGYLGLGGVTSANQSAYQTVTIPTNAIAVNLDFFLNVFSSTHSTFDTFSVAIGDTNGNPPTVIASTTGAFSDSAQGSAFYTEHSLDLLAHKGQSIRVYFLATLGLTGTSTVFDVEDVALKVALPSDIPSNDNFANRALLTGAASHVTATNTFATREPGEPRHAGNNGGKSLWWKWLAPTNGILELNTANTDFPALLAVYTGTAVDQLTRLASADPSQARDSISRVKVIVTTGSEYEIAVDGMDGAAGTISLSLSFTATPFATVKGTYGGLFYDTNGVTLQNAGFFSAILAESGKITAKLQFASGITALSGTVAADGIYSNTIARRGRTPLIVQLFVDVSGSGVITGEINDGTSTAQLLAYRSVFSRTAPAPDPGKKFTMVVAPAPDAATGPGGYGSGSISIDVSRKVTFTGTLGDGTRATQRTFISDTDQWPFFAKLYGGKGLILGWLDVGTTNVSGAVAWIKSAQPTAKLYPTGFDLPALDVTGSVWSLPPGAVVFDWTQGNIVLEGGNLAGPVTNPITVGPHNRITGPNKASLTISTSKGSFRGKVVNPETGKLIPVTGAILQDQNLGFGCFVGATESGSVVVGP